MNPEVKTKWLEALRSGEYKQARDQLRDDEGFCCLGVLCDIHAKETGGKWNGHSYDGQVSYLPNVVRKWAGVEKFNPPVKGDYLGNLNDRGRTFKEIADIIEAEL